MRHAVNTWLLRAPTQRRRVTRVNIGCDTVAPSAKMFECESYRRGPTQLTFVSIIGVVVPLGPGDVGPDSERGQGHDSDGELLAMEHCVDDRPRVPRSSPSRRR